MDILSNIKAPSMAMASALAVTTGAYLDAKLGVSTDISSIRNDRAWAKRLEQRIARMEDSTTIYRMLEHAVMDGHGSTEALWFEQKTWTYYQLKDSELYSGSLCTITSPRTRLMKTCSDRPDGSSTSCQRPPMRRRGCCVHDQFPRDGCHVLCLCKTGSCGCSY